MFPGRTALVGGIDLFTVRLWSIKTAVLPKSYLGTRKVVKDGVLYALSLTSSMPTTEMSSGQNNPASLIASIAPNAARSLTAKTAVGGSGRAMSFCICTYPFLGFPETGLG